MKIGLSRVLRFDEPMEVDSVEEFHSTRLLLLLEACRKQKKTVKGRTKLAKLDFFVRYPSFLETALDRFREEVVTTPEYSAGDEGVESSMIRYKFGPWDHRYFDLISMLVARNLIKITGKDIDTYSLTQDGKLVVSAIWEDPAFEPVAMRCEIVALTLGGMTGTKLKEFVYAVFIEEVTEARMGSTIVPVLSQSGRIR